MHIPSQYPIMLRKRGCGEKKTEQDNGTDNPATVINWQEETKDTPDVVQGQETLPLELQKLEKWRREVDGNR